MVAVGQRKSDARIEVGRYTAKHFLLQFFVVCHYFAPVIETQSFISGGTQTAAAIDKGDCWEGGC